MIIYPARGQCLGPDGVNFVQMGRMRVLDDTETPLVGVRWIDLKSRKAGVYQASGPHLRIATDDGRGRHQFAVEVVSAKGWVVRRRGARDIKV